MSASTSLAQLEQALVDRLRANKIKIPPYPAVATRLDQIARDPRHNVAELATVVSSDPALAAAVIGRANTAAQGGTPVTSVGESIKRLGVDLVIQLSLSLGLGKASTDGGPLGALRRNTWRCSLLAARFAQELASKRGVSPEVAYLAGLLHDFGEVVLVAGIEDIAKDMPLPVLPEVQWQAFVGKLHVQVGMAVAARWNLPAPITDVIAHHRDPANLPASPLTQLIKLVDRVIAILDRSPATGIAALLEVPELATMERYAIGAAAQEVGAQMASYIATAASVQSAQITPEPARSPDEEAWPIDFEVSCPKHDAYRALTMSPNTFEMAGKDPLAPGWLVELTLGCMPTPIAMLANVKTCEQDQGGYKIVLQPFALGGDLKKQWNALLDSARVLLEEVA
ncbi:MAG: HDOD domain-containing protein [Kofleriaceae bacterium]